MSVGTTNLKLQVGGTLVPGRDIYIKRPEDDELLETLQSAEYANVLTSRQMGKSSLVVSVERQLHDIGTATAIVDCSELGFATSLDHWYRGLLEDIADQLQMDLDVERWWTSSRAATPNQRLTQFFAKKALPHAGRPLVIFLDEIDSTLRLDFTDDLFVAMRAMYNQRGRKTAYQDLTFCLVGVATPNELIKDRRTTPYNIGRAIELRDFDIQRDDLSPLYSVVADDDETGERIVRAVLEETDGHPYLTDVLCDAFARSEYATDSDVPTLTQQVFRSLNALRSDVHFETILRFVQLRIKDRQDAVRLYSRIRQGVPVRDEVTSSHLGLKLAGLVKRNSEGNLVVRNPIYKRLFVDSKSFAVDLPYDSTLKATPAALSVAVNPSIVACDEKPTVNATGYKAFVSSTFTDLKDHRRHVITELRKAGFAVDPMEDWTASSDEPKEFSTSRLQGCHLCVLLIARRRGHVPDGEARSITQMEVDEARRRGIDVLPFLLDDDVDEKQWPWKEKDVVQQWRGEFEEHNGVQTFKKTPSTLKIGPALTRWVSEQGPKTALRLYLEAVKQEHGSIRFVSLPRLEDNPDAPIQHLYVKPNVAGQWVSPDVNPGEWPDTTPILEALNEHDKLVVLGDPGSGKSTLVSWLSWQLAADRSTGSLPVSLPAGSGQYVPIPMILRDLDVRPGVTWDSLLESFANTPLGRSLTLENLQEIVNGGRAMIMLDGLDEIGSVRARHDLRDTVWSAFEQHEACRWLLTSRIVGYDEARFDWRKASGIRGSMIPPAEPERTWATLRYVAPFNDDQVDQFAHNWFYLREASDVKAAQGAVELCKAIRGHESTTKLGRIPNLLTMMALIFRVKAYLPHGRALLYNEIAEAYLISIDQWRRILTRTEPWEERRRWLSRVAFEMQRRRAKSDDDDAREILASGDDVRAWVAAAMNESGAASTAAEAAEFVDYLGHRTGLLLPRGEDQFAFLHLSFQEYFAACYLQQKITGSAAWIKQDARRMAPGTSREELVRAADQAVWRETFLFFIELLAASEPEWLEDIHPCLFGEDFADIAGGGDDCRERAMLLARLTADPHAGFRDANGLIDAASQRAVEACCRWEVNWQTRRSAEQGWAENDVLRILLACEPPSERQRIVRSLAAVAQEAGMTRLNLSFTAIADLTPLSGLASLQWLWLDNTSVSDLTPLSGLASLQGLYLQNTSVSKDDVAALQKARKQAGLPEIPRVFL